MIVALSLSEVGSSLVTFLATAEIRTFVNVLIKVELLLMTFSFELEWAVTFCSLDGLFHNFFLSGGYVLLELVQSVIELLLVIVMRPLQSLILLMRLSNFSSVICVDMSKK